MHSAQSSRASILVAVEFLSWLDQHGRTIGTLGQSDVDRWLTTGPPRRYAVRGFLGWAANRSLTTVTAPARTDRRTGSSRSDFLLDDEHTTQLRSCITNDVDPPLPLAVRVAGALVLLFGATVNRIVQLTRDDIDRRGHDTYLILGNKPVQLPTRLADLVQQLIDEPAAQALVTAGSRPTRYLFPGMVAGQLRNAKAFSDLLTRHGITSSTARNTTRRALAEQLPAAVIADLLGMHVNTAVRWARQTNTSWTSYLAERARQH